MLIWSLIVFTLVFLSYRFYWQPRQLQREYARAFKKAGYRVLEVPFRPLTMTLQHFIDYGKKSKDAMKKVKEIFPQYDVVIMNMFKDVQLILIHPDLIREFLSAENLQNYTKTTMTKELFKRGEEKGWPSMKANCGR